MHIDRLAITRGRSNEYLKMLKNAVQTVGPSRLDAAVAYATNSGVASLTGVLSRHLRDARKRWLIGIDYCRSDPNAIKYLEGIPYSRVRIFDGRHVAAQRGCAPRISYHPKVFVLHGEDHSTLVLGSGNLSYTGLQKGIEAGVSVAEMDKRAIRSVNQWFSKHWRNACPWPEIEEIYTSRYSSVKNRRSPMASDDDDVPMSATRRGNINAEQLRKLRVCRHLWIQAGNLHENRGAGRPGNQLMLKRNSRVFFGFPAIDLPTDSLVGRVDIESGGTVTNGCTIRFSNNSMDVLTLPIPGNTGPLRYDRETLCFRRIGIRRFGLLVGSNRELNVWKRKSRRIDGSFAMRSGREWGVF